MKRDVARTIATIAWLGSLVLLVPARGASLVCYASLLVLPLSISGRSDYGFILSTSGLTSILVVLLTSTMVVRLSENRQQALRRVGLVDVVLILTALILTFVFGL